MRYFYQTNVRQTGGFVVVPVDRNGPRGGAEGAEIPVFLGVGRGQSRCAGARGGKSPRAGVAGIVFGQQTRSVGRQVGPYSLVASTVSYRKIESPRAFFEHEAVHVAGIAGGVGAAHRGVAREGQGFGTAAGRHNTALEPHFAIGPERF